MIQRLQRVLLVVWWVGWGAVNPGAAAADAVIVAADGSGTFKTVQAAVDAAPDAANATRLFLITLKPGTYKERLTVPKGKGPIKIHGEDAAKTIITFDNHAGTPDPQGGTAMGTSKSASAFVYADDFTAENVTFENSHGPGSQAIALYVVADRAVFRRCRFLGWQDTLQLNRGRSYFDRCQIAGSTDFIFGGGTAFFDQCELRCLTAGFITAASTEQNKRYGFVFSHCRITAETEGWKTFLGRPWRPYASVIFLNTTMPTAAIRPEGWMNWGNPENEKTARFAESGTVGADTAGRVPWAKALEEFPARTVTVQHVLDGWDPNVALSGERIAALPAVGTREAWLRYVDRSRERLRNDRAVLAAECKSAGLVAPVIPPSGSDFRLETHPDSTWFASPEAARLADNVLSFQTPSGGWSKHLVFDKERRKPGMHWSSQGNGPEGWHYVGTFDNGTTTGQMRLLAGVAQATGRREARDGVLRGLNYVLDAQFPNGGWPQNYPLEGGYHDHVTFNDDAMVLILDLLRDVAARKPEFAFVDEPTRRRAADAVALGIQCILKSQVVQNERKTVWCAQHEPLTLAPAAARLIEPASLSGGESVGVVRFLMGLPMPSSEVVQAVEGALAWFEGAKVTGMAEWKQEGQNTVPFEPDPNATQPLWARFYDLVTNRPIFPGGRDGIPYDSFAAMSANNPVGYRFYLSKPEELLTRDQVKWRQALAQRR